MKILIIGLGNIGEEYNDTRHNIGFNIVNEFAAQFETKFEEAKYGKLAEIKYAGKHLYILKPNTYMNLCGKAYQYYLQLLNISPLESLIIVDDLALPLGKLRLKGNGGSAGHNGLKSISDLLGHQNYPRLRFGIGNNFSPGRQVEFVLGKWKKEEQTEVTISTKEAVDAILFYVKNGLNNSMTKYNQTL